MDGRKRLPDAELSVMQAVWAHGGEVSRGDIEGALASHGWSVNTINTYLTQPDLPTGLWSSAEILILPAIPSTST